MLQIVQLFICSHGGVRFHSVRKDPIMGKWSKVAKKKKKFKGICPSYNGQLDNLLVEMTKMLSNFDSVETNCMKWRKIRIND